MADQEPRDDQMNGFGKTDTFVREVEDDPVLKDLAKQQTSGDPKDENGDVEHNKLNSTAKATETSVRDASEPSSRSNDNSSTARKKYSLSVDAPPFIPSGATKQIVDAIVAGTPTSVRSADMSALTDPAFSGTVAEHLNKISGASEQFRTNFREELKTLIPPQQPVNNAGFGQSDAPLANGSHQVGDGSENVTALDEKLHSIPAENEGIVEDCRASYALPVNIHEEEVPAPSETVIRNTDATTTAHKAEEILAEIDDTTAALPEWQDVLGNGALMKKTVRKGQQGTRPVRSAIVTIRTSAEVLNSDLDASALLKVVDKHDALRFTVSDLEVIQGLEFAVQLMDLGELAEVKIAPKFAYGDMGDQASGIPSDATLLYTIELLKVEPPQEIENLPVLERVVIANHKVDRGNFWYLRKEPMLALSLYQRAVSILEAPNERYISPEDTLQLNAAKARAYGNLSSAQVEEKVWDEGLRSVNNALRYDPNNGKLWCRKIKIFREKGQFEDAVIACEEVLQKGSLVADSFSQKAREELNTLRKKKRQADDKEKALYQRMLGSQSKGQSGQGSARSSPQPDDLSDSRSVEGATASNRKWLFYGAATAVAIFGAVVGLRYYQTHR